MRKIWIDCDTGTDDAIALFTALYFEKEIEIIGVSTVAGNAPLTNTFPNTRNVLSLAEREDIPVFKGADRPLSRELVTAAYAHGANGLNGVILALSQAKEEEKVAWEAMAEAIEKYAGEIELVAVGPLTNLGLLFQNRPDLKDKIQRILVMGGGIQKGNITPHAEFNIYVDPEAANLVFSSGLEVMMFGLDVTEEGYLLKDEFQKACSFCNPKSKFFADIFREYEDWFENDADCKKYFHDSNPIVFLVEPELYEGNWAHVHVECEGEKAGKTIAEYSEEGKVFVVNKIHRALFAERIIAAVSK